MNTHFSFPLTAGLLACLVLLAALHSWVSRINQFFFFSRTAPQGFAATPPARRITRTYLTRVWMGLFAAALVGAVLVLYSPLSVLGCYLVALLVQTVLCSISFGLAHRAAGEVLAAMPLDAALPAQPASTSVAVSLVDPGVFTPRLITLLFLAPVAAAVAWFVPMLTLHMGFNAFSDAIAANHAEFLTGLGSGLMAGSLALFVQLRYFSRHRSPLARFTASGAVQLSWLGAACVAFSTLCVPMHLVVTRQLRIGLLFVVLAVAILRILYLWTKARLFQPPAVEFNGDQFWHWGLFYYNPSDPALLIQHRSGPGYTLNFARKFSWVLPALLLADLIFLASIHLRH